MSTQRAAAPDTPALLAGSLDRLGDRVLLTDPELGRVEVLRLRPELTASSLFEPAVRRRVEQLAGFVHSGHARVRQVGRLPAPDGRLVIVSDAIDGWRLSDVLEAAGPSGVAFHADAVLFLVRQLLETVADLHQVALGVSHGALGPERLVVTADGRLVVTESVLGSALRYLPPMSPDRLWRDFRLAVADGEAQPFGRLTDLRQIGVVALSLAIGRQLRRDEYPARLAALLRESAPSRPGLGAEVLGPALRGWLLRVLSLSGEMTTWSVTEARRELDRLVESDRRYAFAPTGLPAMLGAVADYYAGAADVPVTIDEPAVPSAGRAGLAQRRPPDPAPPPGSIEPPALAVPTAAPNMLQPALEVPPREPDDSRPEPVVLPAVDPLVGSRPAPPVAAHSSSVFAEPPSLSSADGDRLPPGSDAGEPEISPAPVPVLVVDSAPVPVLSPPPLFNARAAEDASAPAAAASRTRTRTIIGLAAAAVLVVALGGYALVRPSSVGATAVRTPSPSQSTAAAAEPSLAPVLPAASAAPADARPAPSMPATPAAPQPAAAPERLVETGSIEIVSPVALNVSEGGRPLGTSEAPIQVPAGRRTLEIGREDLGYQSTQVVDVRPGRVHRIALTLPTGVANLNATPWAEVWIDGRRVGETPLGRVQLTIGPHEVVFRHPEFGDQTRTLVVTAGSVALLSVEWKK